MRSELKFLILCSLVSLLSCHNTVSMVEQQKEMLQADIKFSNLCKKEGMKKAFLSYMDGTGVLLKPDHYPIIGTEAVDFLNNTVDTSFTLTWQPSGVGMSSSGDLGYTYGIYNLHLKDTTLSGTYASIWKLQSDGTWKFVLDTGNPGLGHKIF